MVPISGHGLRYRRVLTQRNEGIISYMASFMSPEDGWHGGAARIATASQWQRSGLDPDFMCCLCEVCMFYA